MRRVNAILLLAGLAACGQGNRPLPPPPPDGVPAAAAYLVDLGAPAAGIGLWDGVTRECAVTGLRRIEGGEAVADGDLWHIGSVTKSMTATLAARLVQSGALRWDSTVGEVLMPVIPGIHPGYRDVTLEHLLSHRGGTRTQLTRTELQEFRDRQATDPDMRGERRHFVARTLSTAPETAPGTRYAYSNIGYVAAGAMIETVTGLTWEDALRLEVFTPLDLGSAGFGPPGRPGVVDQPRGHDASLLGSLQSVEPGPDADNPRVLGPAGTVHISLCDLLRYVAAHGTRPTDYLRADLWSELHRSRGDDYALGWTIVDETRLVHVGSNSLWLAVAGFRRTDGRAVAIVSNHPDAPDPLNAMLAVVGTLVP